MQIQNRSHTVINKSLNLDIKHCNTHGPNCDGACVDPNVDNGMMTKVWGPAGWLFLHCVTLGYPYAINSQNSDHQTKAEDYYNFFYYLGRVMPCKYCRDSYQEFFREHDLRLKLKNRHDIAEWLYTIHNRVNHKLGVPKCQIPSFKEVMAKYESFRARCKKTTEQERQNNQAKGCVTPADGTPRRCVVKVVQFDKGDVTRRQNADISTMIPSSDDYILLSNRRYWLLILAVALLAFTTIALVIARQC